TLYFRAYDDGVAFRYELAKTDNTDTLLITDENTEFKLTGDHTTWWTPGDWDIYEHTYNETKFSAVDATSKRDHPNLGQTYIPENSMNTPVTMKTEDGVYLA
ncbi:MAG: glycoside hydrolase family 97 N-terminal domain-containing protein, partial [Owenweeksia sp.]